MEGVHVTDVCEHARKLRLVHDGTLLSPVCSCHVIGPVHFACH